MKINGIYVDENGWPIIGQSAPITPQTPDSEVFIRSVASRFDYSKKWSFAANAIAPRVADILGPALLELAERQGFADSYDYTRIRGPRARAYLESMCDDWFLLVIFSISPPSHEPVSDLTKEERNAIKSHFAQHPPRTAVECDLYTSAWFYMREDQAAPRVVRHNAIKHLSDRLALQLQKLLIEPGIARMFLQDK